MATGHRLLSADMPEGDTLRRLAARISAAFEGQTVLESTFRHPQLAGFDLTGRTLTSVDATGKHLLCRFDDGRTLHVHLLMQGRVSIGPRWDIPEWRRRFEVRFENDVLTGIDIPLLHLVETSREDLFVGHLGPDLCGVYDHDAATARLQAAANQHLSAALLDQQIVAGFGNIYAVETPFICGLSPFTLVGDIEHVEQALAIGAALIRTNAALGPQNTTGRRLDTSAQWILPNRVRLCPICGETLRRLSERDTPWRRVGALCPSCQPESAVAVDLARVKKLLALHPARRMLDFATGELTGDTSTPVSARPNR